jgi:hypothetical protein
MGVPLTVVVLVASGGGAEPATLAIERAAHEALGHGARVVICESAGAPTDGEALASAPAGEGSVVEVIWGDAAHRVASLRVHVNGRTRWVERTIGFGSADAEGERGRTIGFTLAAMVPEPEGLTQPSPPPSAPVAAPPLPAAPASKAAPDVDDESALGPISRHEVRYTLDLFGLAATALGGDVQTAGGGAALETFLTSFFALRIGGSVRAGSIGGARAHVLALLGSGGIALHPWRTGPSRFFGASVRADYVIMNQSVTHASPAGSDVSTRARPLSGFDVFFDTEWRLATGADLFAGAGVESVLATTYVDLNGSRMATLPPWAALADAGLRLGF